MVKIVRLRAIEWRKANQNVKILQDIWVLQIYQHLTGARTIARINFTTDVVISQVRCIGIRAVVIIALVDMQKIYVPNPAFGS